MPLSTTYCDDDERKKRSKQTAVNTKQKIDNIVVNVYPSRITDILRKRDEGQTLITKIVKDIEQIKNTNRGGPQKVGFAAEILHTLTFNQDAISKGSTIRADLAKYGHPTTDIVLKDVSKDKAYTLSTVQVKYGTRRNVDRLGESKYSQVDQKVAPKGMGNGRYNEKIVYDNVSSVSFSNEEVNLILLNPKQLSDKFRVDTRSTISKAMLVSGVVSACINTSFVLIDAIRTAISNHEITREGLVTTSKTALKTAVISGVLDLIAVGTTAISGNSTAGGVTPGLCVTLYNMYGCCAIKDNDDRKQCLKEEGLTGISGATIAFVAGALCASLLGPYAPLATMCSFGAGYVTRAQVRTMIRTDTDKS